MPVTVSPNASASGRAESMAAVTITDELNRRSVGKPDHLREKLAYRGLARKMSEAPDELLPELVRLAMELCDADSAGISILEGAEFRWFGLTGRLAAFEGATTPRHDSPCGVCIDQRSAVLMRNPERVYRWIADAAIVVPEVLLVPLIASGGASLGTLWMVAREGQHWDAGHAFLLSELAAFTGTALQVMQSDRHLKKALEEQQKLLREMRHRVSNLFAITDSMVQLTALSAGSVEEMASSLSGRLRALADAHALVRASFGPQEAARVDLEELTAKILKPYRTGRIEGGHVALGERATNGIALVLYELATNAAKYGALSNGVGTVHVGWQTGDTDLVLTWRETGGPPVRPPARKGFGTTLIDGTIADLGGSLRYDWQPAGLEVGVTAPLNRLAL